MHTEYPRLLSPLSVGGTTFKNRVFTAPITLHSIQGSEPYPSEAAMAHFANKARGGAACVTCAGVSVFPVGQDMSGHATWDAYAAPNLHYLAQLADRIHFHGAKASMELGVAGVVGGEYGASEGITLMAGNPAKEMPEAEMDRIADGYAGAAAGLVQAGFDMALLHFGHGLLVGQFLSPLTNHRKDEYGGSLENRARFPLMIIDRIRAKVGRRLLLEMRISGSEIAPGGIEVDEAIAFTRLVQDRIDLVHVSAGMHTPQYFTVTHPCNFLPPMPNVRFAEAVKKAGVGIPVVAIGGIQDLAGAEAVLRDGKADFVSVARGFIADPDLGEKAYAGRGADVRPCVKCMRCHDSAVFENRFLCTVNPEIGLEHSLAQLVRPAARRRRVVVIGGGPAGMQAALVASSRGHEVTIVERGDRLGGTLLFSEKVGFKSELRAFKDHLAAQVAKAGVRVLLNTAATPESAAAMGADFVVAAIGAEPIRPPIPGLDGGGAVMALDAYGREAELGDDVAIIGGGQVGCETALHLAMLGKRAAILEMRPELAPDASVTHRGELLDKLAEYPGIRVLTRARCARVEGTTVYYVDAAGTERSVAASKVIVAAGMRARSDAALAFGSSAPRFAPVGDCVRSATVENATRSAYAAASAI